VTTFVPDRRCRLGLLGSFRLDHDEQPLPARDSGARLLAYLALHGRNRPVARSALAEQLWEDSDGSRTSARLRSALWRLPKAAGQPLVTTDATSVRLADFVDVDLWQAEELARELAAEAEVDLERSTLNGAGFHDDLLPNWSDDWLVLERESFRQTRLHALERASERLCRQGSHEAALQAALTAVACEPLRETAHRRVIEAHLAEGNHAEALRQYQSYRRLLAVQLGLAPTPAIRALVAPLLGRPVDMRRRADAVGSPEKAGGS
jgi:DNA-binding SARP family transcriptional activator